MRRATLRAVLAAIIISLTSVQVSGTTWHIYADGSGDAPTIAAAVALAATGDSILVYSGTYYEHGINVNKQLYIRSMGVSYIDAQSLGRHFLFNTLTSTITIQGFRMINGTSLSEAELGGGAVLCKSGAHVNFVNCSFQDNISDGGGVAYIGGAVVITFKKCSFLDNQSIVYSLRGHGGALEILGALSDIPNVTIDSCYFYSNSAAEHGGAVYMNDCQVAISHSTFRENNVDDTTVGAVEILDEVTFTMENTIVSNSNCYGVYQGIPPYTGTISCCDVYGNASGNYGGYISDQTGLNDNISADPLYCGSPIYGFISTISPCAPAYSPCGELIGFGDPLCEKGPNLVIASVQWSNTNPQPGTTITGTVKVKNTGDMSAGAFYVDYYKNRATAPPVGLHGDEYYSVGSLAAGDSVSWTTTPVTSSVFTEWQSYFRVDTYAQVLELNENDNLGGPYTIAWQVPGEEGWPTVTGSAFHSSPVIADVNGDLETFEIAIGCDNGSLYVWTPGGADLTGFPVTLPAAIWSSPAVGDITGGYRNEIVVGCDDGNLYAFDSEGTQLWAFPAGTPVRTTPSLADLDGDRKLEIICGAGNYLHVLTGGGKPYEGWPYKEDVTFASPAVGDVDFDGAIEIAATARSGESVSKVYLFEADGELYSTAWPVQLNADIETGPAIGNIVVIPIRRYEIVVGATDGKVYVITTGGSVWTTIPQVTGSINSSPIIEDADGDGYLDIVVSSKVYAAGGDPPVMRWNGYVTAINGSGAIIPGWPQAAGYWPSDVGPLPSAVALGTNADLMAGSPYNSFFSWYGDGTRTPSFPIYFGANIITSAAAGDVDGDGWVELFVATNGGQVHGRELRSYDYSEGELWWPMFGHDRLRTHCYGFDVPTGMGDEGGVAPKLTALGAIYPNPFNPSATISFDLSERMKVEVAIFDVSGKRVATLVDRELEANRHTVTWDGRTLGGGTAASGVYFCRFRAGSLTETRKMVLLK